MYKRQMKFQKILCLFALVVAALFFVYSLGIMTDLYDCLYSTMLDPSNLYDTDVPGSILYYDMQPFNRTLLKYSIISILAACFLLITNTHIRRRYYFANYLSCGFYSIWTTYCCVWAHIYIEKYKAMWLNIDFAALKKHSEMWKTYYTESTFWFDVHYVIFGLALLIVILIILNFIWKKLLEKGEKELVGTKVV